MTADRMTSNAKVTCKGDKMLIQALDIEFTAVVALEPALNLYAPCSLSIRSDPFTRVLASIKFCAVIQQSTNSKDSERTR